MDAVLPRTVGVGDIHASAVHVDGEVIIAVVQRDDQLLIKAREGHGADSLPVLGDDGGKLSCAGLGRVEQQCRDHGQGDDGGGHQCVQRLRPQAGR